MIVEECLKQVNGHASLSLGESYMKDKIGNGLTRQEWK